jgi:DNA-binding LacI/PurR family transcriptional regulator
MTRALTRQPDSASKIDLIQGHFRSQIRKGKLVAGDRLPPERQLADQFGVSLLTVNKAMAGLESEMLLDRQASRGTYIHPDVSRGQILVVFDTCHFAVPELAGFYHQLLQSLTTEVKGHNMRPTHILGYGQPGEDFVDSLEPNSTIWNQAAGVLAMADLEWFEDILKDKGVPAVTLTTFLNQGHHPVVMNMHDLMIKAYKHLLDRGCRNIALIFNISTDSQTFKPDFLGRTSYQPHFYDELVKLGLPVNPQLVKASCRTAEQGYEAMCDLWHSDNKPDGVIVSDDNTAMGVGKAVRDLQIKTPDELKLVTHATVGVDRDFPIDFTRCQFDLKRVCRGAFGLLYRLMTGERNAQRLIIKAAINQGITT